MVPIVRTISGRGYESMKVTSWYRKSGGTPASTMSRKVERFIADIAREKGIVLSRSIIDAFDAFSTGVSWKQEHWSFSALVATGGIITGCIITGSQDTAGTSATDDPEYNLHMIILGGRFTVAPDLVYEYTYHKKRFRWKGKTDVAVHAVPRGITFADIAGFFEVAVLPGLREMILMEERYIPTPLLREELAGSETDD